MPPSTVFSYLRRDHRRQSPSSTTASPVASTFPQLPPTLGATTRTESIFESGPWAEPSELKDIPDFDGSGLDSLNEPPPLPLIARIPSRPHSSSGETSQSFLNQPIIPKPINQDVGPQKGISSWKRSFGGPKVGTVAGASAGGTGKGKAPDTSASGASNTPRRELKLENPSSKRDVGFDTQEPPSSRGKMKFHLLNPMTLLARRRSTQYSPRAEDINIGKLTLPALPDDYDPRIRGKLFHDFSNPRPRANRVPNNVHTHSREFGRPSVHSEDGYFSDSSAQVSRRNRQSDHKPVFKEDFEDGAMIQERQEYSQQQETTGSSLPAFARKLPANIPAVIEDKPLPAVPPRSPEIAPQEVKSAQRTRPLTVRDASTQGPSGLPKHLMSTASRFSFDLAGGDSASQERLLEEKHKEKEAARKAKEEEAIADDGFESEEFDYDAMMDDDGLEERIPGVNADADDFDDFDIGEHDANENGFGLQALPAVPCSFLLSPTSSEGFPSPQVSNTATNLATPPPLRIDTSHPLLTSVSQPPQIHNGLSLPPAVNQEDDMYYDDGLFGELPEEMQDQTFDESIFDDEASHLYERKRTGTNTLSEVPASDGAINVQAQNSLPPVAEADESDYEADAPTLDNTQKASTVLTRGNLEAYHDALAQAANAAANEGRFERRFSVSEASVDHDIESQPDLTAGESRHTSQNIDSTILSDDAVDDFNFYDADDLDDDIMIAAANAEVLENDDEGFYGQEFGFYAHCDAQNDSERVLGGYFVDGVKRSRSGRNNFREPSLTPITERSEWSTRNSVVSLAPLGGQSNPSIASPPLSQLLDMAHLDDEISLTALMRLRRGAFGGSNGSLGSSATSQTGQSPQSPSAPGSASFGTFSSFHSHPLEQKRNSGVMVSPVGMNASSRPDSFHLNQNELIPTALAPRHDVTQMSPTMAKGSDSLNVEAAAPTNKPRSPETLRRHIRSNSGTESISYVKETDESGANCWVLERRRMGDDGEDELVKREIMSSGRI